MRKNDISVDLSFAAQEYSRDKKYWLNKLAGELTRISFPFDYSKRYKKEDSTTDTTEPGFDTVRFRITGELLAKLIRTSNNSDMRLFIIIAAVMMILIHKYTGHEDIIVGTSIEKQEIEGTFINTILALRTRLAGRMTFKEFLLQVRQVVIEAGEYQNYPLESIPYELNMDPGEDDEFPLFDIAVLLRNIHDRRYLDHINLSLIFSFLRVDGCIEGEVEYRASLYKKETLERVVKHFLHLLQEVFINMNVEVPIAGINILTQEERDYLLVGMNDTAVEYPDMGAVHRQFEARAEKTPDSFAVKEVDSGRVVSYRQLNERANQSARLLRSKGLKPGKTAAIMGERTLEIIIGILAILKTGASYLPLDGENPDERIGFILEESNSCLFLSQKHIILQRQGILRGIPPGNVIVLDNQEIYKGDAGNLDMDIHIEDPAYLIYTSGTTGRPKGVIIRHKSLVNYINWAIKSYIKTGLANFPFYTSIAFDLTITSIFTPLVTGNMIVVYGGWDKGNLIARIVNDNLVEVVKLTPSHLDLIRDKKISLSQGSRIRCFIVGGEALDYQLAKEIHDNFHGKIEIYNEYGPTEATVGCMLYKFNPAEENQRSVPIGLPADNAHIYLLDRNLSPVPVGAIGEIYVSGSGIAIGYLNRPELTAEKFLMQVTGAGDRCRWNNQKLLWGVQRGGFLEKSPSGRRRQKLYKTGDLARWRVDGNIEFLGRIDHQVKIRGFRIELAEIERHLLEHNDIKAAVVTLKETNNRNLCAYYVSDKALTAPGLREYLSARLPGYMVPSFFIKLAAVPLNPNGKVDKKALPEPGMKTEAEYAPPGNPIEVKLVEIWSDLLGINKENIGIDADFFELGGHSLSATVLAAKIHKELNAKLLLTTIFKSSTIRELAQDIKNESQEESQEDSFVPLEPVEEKEYYLLSSAQKRLYILQYLKTDNNISYNIPYILEVEGSFSRERLERVFRELIKRHDNFRTSFQMIGGEPLQRIHNEVLFKVESYDSGRQGNREIGELIKEFIRSFDLSQAPLLRVGLIELLHTPTTLRGHPRRGTYKSQEGKGKHVLMIDMHHIVSDGISMAVFVKECMALYAGKELPPLKIQYKDYSEWQNSEKGKKNMRQQEAYWLQEFTGEIPVLELPLDYPRPSFKGFEGSSFPFELADGEAGALREMALQEETTPYILLLSIYNLLLSKLSGQEDIIVGTPVSGRRHADLDYVMGMFVNTLALRNYPAGERSFRDFLKEVTRKTLDAFENQDYPFEDMVEWVSVARDVSRNPVFDVMFDFDNVELRFKEETEIEIPGVNLKPYHYEYKISKFDMTLIVLSRKERLLFSVEYCTQLFKKETIARFVTFFKGIVSSVLSNPDRKISDIEIILEKEREQVLYDFNATQREFPRDKALHWLFEEQAEKIPHHVAVVSGDQQLSYGELDKGANRLAWRMREKGVGKDNIVAIVVERSLEMIIGLMGILKAGGAYLPIDHDYPASMIDFILRDSCASLLLTKKDYKEKTTFEKEILYLEDEKEFQPGGPKLENPGYVCSCANLLYVIYTSGTTGQPKGAMLEHRSLVNRLKWMQEKYPLEQRDTLLQKTRFTFDVSVWEIFWWAIEGARVSLLIPGGEKDPTVIVDTINRDKITVIHFVPSMLSAFLDYVRTTGAMSRLSCLRQVFASGEALTLKQVQAFVKLLHQPNNTQLANLYGPTEAAIDVSSFDCTTGDPLECIPIGKPVYNTQLFILSQYKQLQPIGVPGELYIAGVCLARGYLNRQELTVEKFVEQVTGAGDRCRWNNQKFLRGVTGGSFFKKRPPCRRRLYRTGDLARWLADGNIEFLGRIDHQVKIRGFRIEPAEIETQLLKHEKIKEIIVIPRTNENNDTHLYAYIVPQLHNTTEISGSELRDYLANQLPEYMIPSFFIQIEKIPLTLNGKVNRKALYSMGTTLGSAVTYVSPRNDVEKILVDMWKKVLKLEKVGVYDKFFELGGTSLELIKLNDLLKDALDVDIPIAKMFSYNTIHSLALYLNREDSLREAADGLTSNEIIDGSVNIMEETISMFLEEENE